MNAFEPFTLAPLSAGDIIDRAVRLYRRYFLVLLRVVLAPSLVAYAGGIAYTFGVRNFSLSRGDARLAWSGALILGGGGIYLLGKVAFFALLGGMARVLLAHFVDGAPLAAREVYRAVRPRLWPLLGAMLLLAALLLAVALLVYMVVAVAGVVYLLIATWLLRGWPGWLQAVVHTLFGGVAAGGLLALALLIYARVAYVPQALVVEGRGVMSALGRSIRLAGRDVRRVGAIVLFQLYVAWSLFFLLLIPLGWYGHLRGVDVNPLSENAPLWYDISYQTLTQVSEILLTPIALLGFALLYIDSRVRLEGLDVELLANRRLPLAEGRESSREGSRVRSPLSIAPSLLLPLFLSLLLPAEAATPWVDYRERVARASRMVAGLNTEELDRIRALLPPAEEVKFGDAVVRVDNQWLHESLGALKPDAARPAELARIAARLDALGRRLDEVAAGGSGRGDEGERLAQILARPEYRTQAGQESFIQKWVGKAADALLRLLLRLFTLGGLSARAPGATTLNLLRLLVAIAAGVALAAGGAWLARRLRRAPPTRAGAAREVLGEQIEGHLTPDDLLAQAAELARGGDARRAIRRAYLALLYELERRGRLRLHRAKTNRDYLDALRRWPDLYPPAEALTAAYERVWYGRREATGEDYANFVDRYRQVTGH